MYQTNASVPILTSLAVDIFFLILNYNSSCIPSYKWFVSHVTRAFDTLTRLSYTGCVCVSSGR